MVDFAFLDSGTGGIPYLLHLMEKSPDSECIYVGDTANFPYGQKSHEEVVDCAISVCKKIVEKFNPKVIVVACNTMSVNALDILREAFPEQKFVGTVPAIKVAGDISKKRCIGLLATNATIQHPYNQDLKNHFAGDCKMILQGAPELISFIEKKSFTASGEEIENAIRPTVEFFRQQGCDVIILGCTHFLNYADVFKKLAMPDIKVVDSVEGVVNRALDLQAGEVNNLQAGDVRSLRSLPSFAFDCKEIGRQNIAGRRLRPVQGVAEDREAGWSEGGMPPSLNHSKVYITGFYDKKDEKEYDVICKRHNLEFGGII